LTKVTTYVVDIGAIDFQRIPIQGKKVLVDLARVPGFAQE
jgi:hypothetical protein